MQYKLIMYQKLNTYQFNSYLQNTIILYCVKIEEIVSESCQVANISHISRSDTNSATCELSPGDTVTCS